MKFTPTSTAEGPPAHCHGGFIATFLDECMGGCAWWNTYVVLAGNLNIKYRKPAPLDRAYYALARVERVENRRVYCSAKLTSRDGTVFAQGDGVFIRLPWEKFPKDAEDHFTNVREFIAMREEGIPIKECIARLHDRRDRLTPPA